MSLGNEAEVIVVGAGIAGLSVAVALKRQGLDVRLLAPLKALPAIDENMYDPRVYAISEANQAFLSEIGAWGLIPESRITAVTDMNVYGDNPSYRWSAQGQKSYQAHLQGHIEMTAWQTGNEALTWIVESREVERALQQVWRVLGGVSIAQSLYALAKNADEGWTLTTDVGHHYKAKLVVGADGGQSMTRRLAGIRVDRRDYDHMGVITHLDVSQSHLGNARQWFTSEGILALLPLPDTSRGHQVSMVWSLRKHSANALLSMPTSQQHEFLVQQLQEVTQGSVGQCGVNSPLYGFPLALQKAQTMYREGLVLVGDAAHLVHPLAGQGLNMGLGDVADLARILSQRESYRAIGDERLLARYQRQRAEPLLAMRLTTDALYHLFYPQSAVLSGIRNVGMMAVNRLPWIKQKLIAGAARH